MSHESAEVSCGSCVEVEHPAQSLPASKGPVRPASLVRTIANILRQHGIEPAPERHKRTTWHEFLKAHWDVLAVADFLTVEVWTCGGLTRFAVLFVVELATRRVEIAGVMSCLDRVILIGEASLRRAIREFEAHYHHERTHQGLQNQLIMQPTPQRRDGSIACRERLGGLLKYYHRPAA